MMVKVHGQPRRRVAVLRACGGGASWLARCVTEEGVAFGRLAEHAVAGAACGAASLCGAAFRSTGRNNEPDNHHHNLYLCLDLRLCLELHLCRTHWRMPSRVGREPRYLIPTTRRRCHQCRCRISPRYWRLRCRTRTFQSCARPRLPPPQVPLPSDTVSRRLGFLARRQWNESTCTSPAVPARRPAARPRYAHGRSVWDELMSFSGSNKSPV